MLPADLRRRAAAIVCSEPSPAATASTARCAIRAQAMTTDIASTFDARDMTRWSATTWPQAAADQVYEAAGVGPEDIDVVELHDCFTTNELLSYEALGLAPEGGAPRSSSTTATTPTAGGW